jgi:hypothetical protein
VDDPEAFEALLEEFDEIFIARLHEDVDAFVIELVNHCELLELLFNRLALLVNLQELNVCFRAIL